MCRFCRSLFVLLSLFFWSLYCLFFFDLRSLNTPLVSSYSVSFSLCVCFVDHCLFFCPFSFGHCVVCSSSIYGVWIPLWYLHIVSVLVLCVCFVDRCLSFCPFSFGHCVVCSSSIYGFWLPLWYFQTVLYKTKPNTNYCWILL
jgi:hypothetical protein